MANRVPLKDISDTLRRSHRLNGVAIPTQSKVSLQIENVTSFSRQYISYSLISPHPAGAVSSEVLQSDQ